MKRLLITIYIFSFTALTQPIRATSEFTDSSLNRANSLLAMDSAQAKIQIEKLTSSEAAVLHSQILFILRKKNPQIDKYAYLIQHLETIRSTELAQKRLNKLLSVIIFILSLFSLFLLFALNGQRKDVKNIKRLLSLNYRTSKISSITSS